MVFSPLNNAVELLQNFGFFQVILPMLLIFAVFYGILIKTGIFGDPDKHNIKGIIAIISFAASFFVVTSTKIVEAINNFLPQASFLLVIAMIILMLFAFLGFKTETNLFGEKGFKYAWVILVLLVVVLLGIVDASSPNINIPVIHDIMLALSGQPLTLPALDQESTIMAITIIVMLALPIIVIWLVMRKPKP